MHNPVGTRTLGAAITLTGALLAIAPMATAQGPPPELPPPPPGVGDAPPGASSASPQVSGGQTPPLTGTGSSGPGSTILPKRGKPVSLAGRSALRGRTLKVGLSCTQGGTVRVSYRGKRVGKARFRCASSKGTARVRLGRKVVRRIKRSRTAALRVTARAGGTRVTRVLRFSRGRARIAAWSRGAHGYFDAVGYCDYSHDELRTIYHFNGSLVSSLPGGDHYWLRFWAYTHGGVGWQQITDWWGAHEVPQEGLGGGRWLFADLFYPAREYWTAGYMELWSYRHGRSWGDYLQTDQLGAGGITVTSGVWCYSKV